MPKVCSDGYFGRGDWSFSQFKKWKVLFRRGGFSRRAEQFYLVFTRAICARNLQNLTEMQVFEKILHYFSFFLHIAIDKK